MCTVLCSSRLSGGGVSAQEVSAQGDACPPVDRILDTRLWKHYLSATSFADGEKFEKACHSHNTQTTKALKIESDHFVIC